MNKWNFYWHSTDFYWLFPDLYWLSTDFYWLSTYFYWLLTDYLETSTDYLVNADSLPTSTDFLPTSTDSLLTSTDSLLTSTDYFLTPTDFYHTSYCHFDRLYTGGGFPRDRRIPYHMPGLMDALRTFGVPFSFYSWLLMLNPGQKFKNRKDNWDPQVGYKRQGDRGKRAPEEEMGLIFPPANIHGTTIECKSIILSKECFISCCR